MATAKPWVFGGRRQASGRGVRRHLAVSDPGPMSVSRRPLAALTDAAVCSFWSGLTLSPWRLSVLGRGLSCRSGLGPMFADGTAGPMVGWGGASPINWFQQVFMSGMISSCQLWIMSGEGPCEVFTASGCITVGATEVGLGADGGTGFPAGWTKRGVALEKTPGPGRPHRAPMGKEEVGGHHECL